jgi:serine/threonine protein kinase
MTIAPAPPDAPEERPENNPPMRLSFCKPVRVRHGGMAMVYLCTRDELGDEVAVKRISPEISAIPGTAEAFLRECYLWLQIGRHPNITKVLGVHRAQNEPPTVVLEYLPSSLRDLLGGRPLKMATILRLLVNIADGLSYARLQLPGFVHSDLKPENILVTEDGSAKITDLGLARALKTTQMPDAVDVSGSGGRGTAVYMAPEHILYGQAVEASDIYAIGCIAHEMVAGELTYGPYSSVEGYLLSHLHDRPTPLDDLRDGVPRALATLVTAMLAKDPEDRPGLKEIRNTLRETATREGVAISVPEAEPVSPGAQLDTAQGLIHLGFHADARRVARKAIEGDNPGQEDRLRGHTLIARAYNDQDDAHLANEELDLAERLLTEDTPNVHGAAYWTERLRVAVSLDDQLQALESAQRTIELVPEASITWFNASGLFAHLGNLEKAIEAAYVCLGIAGDVRYFVRLVNLLVEASRGQEALSVCDRMVEYHSTIPAGYALRGLIRIALAAEQGSIDGEQLRLVRADLESALHYGPADFEQTRTLQQLVESLSPGRP